MGDDRLILRYYERLLSERATMSPAERTLCERVACLLPNLDGGR
jgi:hypothetical protein